MRPLPQIGMSRRAMPEELRVALRARVAAVGKHRVCVEAHTSAMTLEQAWHGEKLQERTVEKLAVYLRSVAA